MYKKTALKIAKDINSTAEQLAGLVGMDDKIDQLVAKHPNATAKILESLLTSLIDMGGMDSKIDRLVAKHPNATAKILESLSRIEILSDADLPPSLIEWIIQHGNEREKLILFCHPLIPTEVLINLTPTDSDDWPSEFWSLREEAGQVKFCMALGLDVKVSTNPMERTYYHFIKPGGRKRYVDFGWNPWDDNRAGKFRLKKIWDKLVPKFGDAKTIQGQFGCIYYRFTNEYWRNGLMNWADESGSNIFNYRWMVEFLEDRLISQKSFGPEATNILAAMLKQLFYINYPARINIFKVSSFETIMEYLLWAFYAYFIKYPELIPNDEADKCNIARNKDIEDDVLEELSGNVSSKVRSAVASNPRCSVDFLRKLSSDRSVQVRLAVVKHDDCPVDCIANLSRDDDIDVRNAAAQCWNFPKNKRQEFIKAQFDLMISEKECAWKLLDISASLSPEFFLKKLAAYFSMRIDKNIGTKDDLWACRRILWQILNNDKLRIDKSEVIDKLWKKYPDISAWKNYDDSNE